jgi:hypothetical protein
LLQFVLVAQYLTAINKIPVSDERVVPHLTFIHPQLATNILPFIPLQ